MCFKILFHIPQRKKKVAKIQHFRSLSQFIAPFLSKDLNFGIQLLKIKEEESIMHWRKYKCKKKSHSFTQFASGVSYEVVNTIWNNKCLK